MRILEYKVTGQRLRPIGDHTGLVAGTKGYLKASFNFDSEWDSYKKVASFYSEDKKEYAEVLDQNNSCMIPSEALTDSTFEVRVWGGTDNFRIPTNLVREHQSGGGK